VRSTKRSVNHKKMLVQWSGGVLCSVLGLVASLIVPASYAFSQEAASEFWAFRAPQRPTIPHSANDTWSKTDIDHFIYDQLNRSDMLPSEDAEPAKLLRRVYFDLIGLPPSPAELDRFLNRLTNENFENIWNDEVHRLIKSDAFGERWGRHWLDVARFGESSGKEANIAFPYAWRYRDYVIDCFKDDIPFDRFLIEQIAGDLLPYKDDAERARLLVATGFLAIGPKNLDEADPKQFAADLIDEQIDTVSRALMAHSIACARCHDHKADPYTMEDYYALAGIFTSTTTYFGTFVSPANRMGGDPLVLPKLKDQTILHKSIPAKQVDELKKQLAALKKEHADGMEAVISATMQGKDASMIFTLKDALRIFWTSGGIEGKLEQVDENGKALPLTMGVLESSKIVDAPLLDRGDIHQPTQPIARRLPKPIETKSEFTIDPHQSGRLQLAHWVTDPSHPLTARVIVNRVWHHLLGAGIVSTVDDFGSTGQPPSHPELLDHLAIQLVEDGWSIKRLVQRIVRSRVYQQSSAYKEAHFQRDPDNRLLWRASKRRLDAEVIRDAMLAASGELDTRRPVGSLVANTIGDGPISLIGLNERIPQDLDGSTHRSVYLPILRDRLPDALAIFDFAEPSLVTGVRETTNVPVQALYLMNSEFVNARSEALASSILKEITGDSRPDAIELQARFAQFIQLAFQNCLSRSPDATELQMATEYLLSDSKANEKGGENTRILSSFCQAIFASAEFRNVD
jgi:Protein of unknown function (DUF1553)/Protein of unknown function (DUF1549)